MLQPAPRHQTTDHSPVDKYASIDAAGPISTPMVAALEQAWADIRARHPQVPPAVIVLGAGSIGARGGLRLGHFAAMRWHTGHAHDQDDQAAAQLAEVFVGGEGLRRAPPDVFGTLLHEAAHALAHVRGIRDTSRQGRWHNTRFKTLAEELGIQVTKDPRIGWSPTTLPDTTRQTYASTIAALGDALRLYRSAELTSGTSKPKNPPACVCACGRRASVSLQASSPPARSPAASAAATSPPTPTDHRPTREGVRGMGVVYCGPYTDQIGGYEHEGYAARIRPDGTETSIWTYETRGFVGYRAHCDCGWRGTGTYPPTEQGENAALDEWDHDHLRPLITAEARRHTLTGEQLLAFADQLGQTAIDLSPVGGHTLSDRARGLLDAVDRLHQLLDDHAQTNHARR